MIDICIEKIETNWKYKRYRKSKISRDFPTPHLTTIINLSPTVTISPTLAHENLQKITTCGWRGPQWQGKSHWSAFWYTAVHHRRWWSCAVIFNTHNNTQLTIYYHNMPLGLWLLTTTDTYNNNHCFYQHQHQHHGHSHHLQHHHYQRRIHTITRPLSHSHSPRNFCPLKKLWCDVPLNSVCQISTRSIWRAKNLQPIMNSSTQSKRSIKLFDELTLIANQLYTSPT